MFSNACGMRSTLLDAGPEAQPLMGPGLQAAVASCPSCRCCLKVASCSGRCACIQEAPQGLQEVLGKADATGKLRIVQQMSINIIPIIEKGLLDPVITHGCMLHPLS